MTRLTSLVCVPVQRIYQMSIFSVPRWSLSNSGHSKCIWNLCGVSSELVNEHKGELRDRSCTRSGLQDESP